MDAHTTRSDRNASDVGQHDHRFPLVSPSILEHIQLKSSFFLIWNQIAADLPPEPKEQPKPSSSSSSSREKEREKKDEKKEEKKPEPSPWDEMRAHPSAFLTSRLNRLLPWPYLWEKLQPWAMSYGGRAAYSITCTCQTLPSSLFLLIAIRGHFNRPVEEEPLSEKEQKKIKENEAKLKERARQKEKEKLKAEEKAKAVKEAAEKVKQKEELARRQKEAEKAKAAAVEAKKREAVELR